MIGLCACSDIFLNKQVEQDLLTNPEALAATLQGPTKSRDHDWLRTDNLVRTADLSAVEPCVKQTEIFRDLSLVIPGHHYFSVPLRLHHQIYANDFDG